MTEHLVPYDSRLDTMIHIRAVQDNMGIAIAQLMTRAREHDRSKLGAAEAAGWDEATPKLAGLEYGSEEYRAALREIRPLVEEHYRWNDHHPEHYERDGCRGMSLMALIEMLCDWKAASLRNKDPKGIEFSIQHNQERFGFTPELADILRNTARELGL